MIAKLILILFMVGIIAGLISILFMLFRDVKDDTKFIEQINKNQEGAILKKGFQYYIIKRVSDIIISLVSAFMFSPLILMLSVLLKLDGARRVIIRKPCVGYKGRTVYIRKFNIKNQDGVVSKVGAFIRRFSLDDLPMFYCVLLGDFTIIGLSMITEENDTEKYNLDYFKNEKPGLLCLGNVKKLKQYGYQRMDHAYLSMRGTLNDVRFFSFIVRNTVITTTKDSGNETKKLRMTVNKTKEKYHLGNGGTDNDTQKGAGVYE